MMWHIVVIVVVVVVGGVMQNLRKADKGAAWALRPNEGFFGRLPDSVIGHILSYLQPKSLVAILRSSKYPPHIFLIIIYYLLYRFNIVFNI